MLIRVQVTYKQSVDYRYNIRGWLVKVNEADVAPVAAGDAMADYFGMELGYHNTLFLNDSNRTIQR
ncbi:MAG TPA: hypothetical protein VK658_11485 [Chryseolinea sp.]|nr:hypothetical protein [Chryseolinea sp.]